MAKKRNNPRWYRECVPEEVTNSSLFKFSVQIGSKKTIEVDMLADLEVDYDIIREQLEDTPSIYAYWSALYSELKLQVAATERRIKAKRGKLLETAGKEAAKGNIRLTQKAVDMMIESDRELNELELKYALQQKHTGKMYAMIQAIQMKSDNLRSLAGFARQEMSQM